MAVYKCSGRKRVWVACDYEAPERWTGPCPGCGGLYNCEKIGAETKDKIATLETLSQAKPKARISTGMRAFDTVMGPSEEEARKGLGGIVKGSTTIISGPPGTGKTSLLLAIVNNIAKEKHPVIFASGEQTAADVGDIASRIHAHNEHVIVMGLEGDIYKITTIAEEKKVSLLVIDSLQTACLEDVAAEEGSAAQCSAVANFLTAWSKREDIAVILVSHISKDGSAAGPMKAHHLVDTMLEFDAFYDEEEGCLSDTLRILAVGGKNRHGPSNVHELFEMTPEGVKPVKKKSKLSLV